MNFSNNMNGCSKHVAGVRSKIVIGKRGVQMRERLTRFTPSEVTLKGHELGALVERNPVVNMVVVHVAIGAFSRPTDATGDGGRIKTDLVGQGL